MQPLQIRVPLAGYQNIPAVLILLLASYQFRSSVVVFFGRDCKDNILVSITL